MWYFMIVLHVYSFCIFGYEEKELHSPLKMKKVVQVENVARKIGEAI